MLKAKRRKKDRKIFLNRVCPQLSQLRLMRFLRSLIPHFYILLAATRSQTKEADVSLCLAEYYGFCTKEKEENGWLPPTAGTIQ